MTELRTFLASLDSDDVRVRGEQFELVCKWFLESEPQYALRLKRVWRWHDWPDRFDQDIGIDLVAETHDGDLWAIQAKYRSEASSISKSEIDSFLAAAGPRFAFRLLVTNATGLGKHAVSALEEQGAGYLLGSDLEAFDLEWPSSLSVLLPMRPSALSALPHQVEAVDQVVAELQVASRAQLLLPCGTGKTVISMWVWERMAPETAVVLVPSLSLLSQGLRSWAHNSGTRFDFAVVCSDQSTVDRDSVVASTAHLGVPVTTLESEIADFLCRPGRKVVFATYQSLAVLGNALRSSGVTAGLVICDEAHRTAGSGSGAFAQALRDEVLPTTSRLFMTATPRVFSPWAKGRAVDDELALTSMDDEELYGRIAYSMTFGEAVGRGLLADYQVAIVCVDGTEVDAVRRRQLVRRDEGDHVDDARSVAIQVALLKAMKRFALARVISFHSRIARAKEFAVGLVATLDWIDAEQRPPGRIFVSHVSGEMATGLRETRLALLRSLDDLDGCVIANARCLAEGIDVPALDGIAFIDPRRSTTDIVQALGRVMRRAPGKRKGTILLPVFVEEGDDDLVALESSAFATVWEVIRALRAHDSLLAEQLDRLRTELGIDPNAEVSLPDRLIVDLPSSLGSAFASAFRARLVTETTVAWRFWFGCLLRFVEEHGHSAVPQPYVDPATGRELGAWVSGQRVSYGRGLLAPDRAEALAGLPGWVWSVHHIRWAQARVHLDRYIEDFGDALPLATFKSDDGFALGLWVSDVRRRFRMGELEPARVQELEELHGWSWAPHEDGWDIAFEFLSTEMRSRGLEKPPRNLPLPSGVTSGPWITKQRQHHAKGTLNPSKVQRLESLPGWKWLAPSPNKGGVDLARLEEWVSLVEKYVEETPVPTYPYELVVDGRRVGRWVITARAAYRSGRIPAEYAERLSSLPGWKWSEKDRRFDIGLSHLRALADRGPITPLPIRVTAGGYRIAIWVGRQRREYAAGTLPPEHVALLEAIPGWTWSERSSER